MMRIINGKRYNTDTAERLASWQNMEDSSNFRYENYGVYRTEKGAFFLCYIGGPMSSRGRKEGNEYHADAGIQPVTPDEARVHLERCGMNGAAAIEKYFPVEDA